MKEGPSLAKKLIPALLAACCVPAYAQIEEVIVIATKRAESIQDVPIAVTAVDQVKLERAGVSDIRDLPVLSASFNLNSSQTESQGTTMRIRGVGTTGNNIGLESAVGVFLDGVYLSRPGVALGDLLDVNQIEILRGPQGTLFGRNTSAGAIVLRTNNPDLEAPDFWANATLGNYSSRVVQAGGNIPLMEHKLALRVSGSMNQRDGWLTSSTSDVESHDRDRWQLRSQLLWQLNDRADLRIIADYAETDEACCDSVTTSDTPLVEAGAFAAAGLPANGGVARSDSDAFDNRKSNAQTQWENPVENWGISAELNWDLDIGTLTYLGAYRDFYASTVQDNDFSGLDAISVPKEINGFGTYDEITTTTHELRLQGETGRLNWLVGAYYMDEEIEETLTLGFGEDYGQFISATIWYGALIPFTAGTPLENVPMPLGGTYGDIINSPNPAVAYAGGVDLAGSYAANLYRQDSTSWSIFTHNTLRLTNELDLSFGLRWVEESKDGSYNQRDASNPACLNTLANSAGFPEPLVPAFALASNCLVFAVPADLGPGLPATFDDTFEDEELVYSLKLVYLLSDTTTVYGGFTHGFKAGGFNLDSTAAVNGADPRFDSEVVDSWEVGIKSDFFDNRMRLNLALFSMEMEDFQVLEFTGVQFQTFNVPTVESEGFELELFTSPFDGLSLNASVTYADARYPNDCDGNDPNTPPNVAALCGLQLTNAPEWASVLSAAYEGSIQGTDLVYFLNANARWEDDRRTETQEVELATGVPLTNALQESNVKVNVRLGIGSADARWQLEAWGTNIFDEQTQNFSFSTALRGVGALGTAARSAFLEAPRTYGVTLRYAM